MCCIIPAWCGVMNKRCQDMLAKAQAERELIARKMAEMESNVIVGGVNLVGSFRCLELFLLIVSYNGINFGTDVAARSLSGPRSRRGCWTRPIASTSSVGKLRSK